MKNYRFFIPDVVIEHLEKQLGTKINTDNHLNESSNFRAKRNVALLRENSFIGVGVESRKI